MSETKERELHPAEIDKIKAEAAAATLTAEAEARKSDAEARLFEAQAKEAELGLVAAQHDADRANEKRKDELASHKYHQVYMFKGTVTDETVNKCMDQLTLWHRNDPGCDIEIIFNSGGGGVTAGMALWDHIQFIRAEGHKVITSTIGMAASMAGILLQAGDVRIMGKESWLLIHEGSFGAVGAVAEVEDTVDWVKKMNERMFDIFASRSKLTKAQVKTRCRRKNWWIGSDEALKLELVDEIR